MPVSQADDESRGRLRDSSWMHDAYTTRGLSRRQIAAELGVAPSTVGHWLQRHAVPVRTAAAARTIGAQSERPDELNNPSWLHDRYHHDGLTIEQIAERVSRSPSTVRAAMDRHGIQTRTELLRDKVWIAVEAGLRGPSGLADTLGVSESTVYRWLDRHHLPTKGLPATITLNGTAVTFAIADGTATATATPVPRWLTDADQAVDGILVSRLRDAADDGQSWAADLLAKVEAILPNGNLVDAG